MAAAVARSARSRIRPESSAVGTTGPGAGPEPLGAPIIRTRLLLVSRMTTSPPGVRVRPRGSASRAEVAGPLSPPKPLLPVPATVLMIPEPRSTIRMRLLIESAM